MTEARTPNYPPEVAQLLTLGEPEIVDHEAVWPDYRAMGLAAAHMEDLLRLAEGSEFDDLDGDGLEDVEIALGLRLVRATPRPR